MGEKRIPGRDGTVTVVSDGYSYGSIGGEAHQPEDPGKYEIKRYDRSGVKALFRWNDEQLDLAQARLNFPKGQVSFSSSRFSWDVTETVTWLERDVLRWKEAFDKVR